MNWRGFQNLVDWMLALFLFGSMLSSVGVYVWQSHAEESAKRRHHVEIVTTMSGVFQFALSSKTEVVYDADNYTFPFLPTPAATDGDSETVVRVSDSEMNAVIHSMNKMQPGKDDLEPESFPPWKSLSEYFGKELRSVDGVHQFTIHDRGDGGEISNCELLIVNRELRLLGYYRWDQ